MPKAPRFASRAHSFNAAAAQYAANRPSYPPALFDAVEELSGRTLTGARVVDVGAGTGIATARLRERGAEVVAVEPGDGMIAEFRRTLPDIPVVRGDGNALPFADASADFVTYAQAWHWTDPTRSVPEAMRVLRPGGVLALWWNVDAVDVPWIAAQAERVERFLGLDLAAERAGAGTRPGTGTPPAGSALSGRGAQAAGALPTRTFDRHRLRWSRRVPLDLHLANIATHSAFLILGQERTTAFLTEERSHLLAAFPDGAVEETYDVRLEVAARN